MNQLFAIYTEHNHESILPALYTVENVALVIAEMTTTLSQTQMTQLLTIYMEHGRESIALSLTHMTQLLAIYMEHGRESMLPALYVAKSVAQVVAEGGDFEDYLALTGTTIADKKAAKKAAKKANQQARREKLADKIKAAHNIVIDASKYTFKALQTMLRTGEMQAKMKKKGQSVWMRFLAQERIKNKELENPVSTTELLKQASQKWRAMSSEEKAAWKATEVNMVVDTC